MPENIMQLSFRVPWGVGGALEELARRQNTTVDEIVKRLLQRQIDDLRTAGVLTMPDK